MRRTNKIILVVLIMAVLSLGIGYAAIQNITLNITGTATANPNQANFAVKFSGTPTVSDPNKVLAAITDDTNATINVEGLTSAGDTVSATYTIQNISSDLSADLVVDITNSNTEYFLIESELASTSLKAGEATTLTITVQLIKTPVSSIETSTIGMQLTVEPVQPGEEGNGSGTGSGTDDGNEENSDGLTTSAGTYLPNGFTEVAGTSLATGLTIEDSLGNQYVWIEVPQDTTVYSAETLGLELDNLTNDELEIAYQEIENDLKAYTSTYRDNTKYTDTWYSEDVYGLTETEYYDLKNKMLKSIFENGGFYIGKYETGIADTEPNVIDENIEARISLGDTEGYIPVIQADAYPYTNVTASQAQGLAEGMESGEHTSSLMFGVQWDLVMKYLETKGATVDELKKSSISWGNFRTGWNVTNTRAKYYTDKWYDGAFGRVDGEEVLLSTGATDTFCKQNIYDLAGNADEITLEYTSDANYPISLRGSMGAYNLAGTANQRTPGIDLYGANAITFRVTIF